jgi:hypothetical protein
MSVTPSRHDPVTTPCPICAKPFTPIGRQAYCSGACRAAAYRRRRDTAPLTPAVPPARSKRPITVYECDGCGERAPGRTALPGLQHLDAARRPRRQLPRLRSARRIRGPHNRQILTAGEPARIIIPDRLKACPRWSLACGNGVAP